MDDDGGSFDLLTLQLRFSRYPVLVSALQQFFRDRGVDSVAFLPRQRVDSITPESGETVEKDVVFFFVHVVVRVVVFGVRG